MRVSQRVPADFHDPNRVSVAGLVPALAVAERAGLHEVVAERVAGSAGANVAVNVSVVVAGMVAGASRIEDSDVLGHGVMSRVLIGVQARTALGTRPAGLRVWARAPAGRGHLLGVGKPRRAGLAVAGRGDQVAAYLDIDDTIRETDGYSQARRYLRLLLSSTGFDGDIEGWRVDRWSHAGRIQRSWGSGR